MSALSSGGVMQAKGLIDTGGIVALLNPKDEWHDRCADAFSSLRLPLATSAAVLAETFHLLDDNPRTLAAAWDLLRSGAVTVLPITDDDLSEIHALMRKYHDRPMDFADATLVRLADRESLPVILTIDHNDFLTYRYSGKRHFRIVPEP